MSNVSNSSLFPQPPTEETCYMVKVLYVLSAMNAYYTPFIILVGSLSNVIASVTLRQTKLKKSAPSQFLAAKCVSDTIFLACVGLLWLAHMGVASIQTDAFCPYLWLASQLSNFLSVWLVVLLCFERNLRINEPDWCRRRRSNTHAPPCSVLRCQAIIIGVVVLGIVVYVNISHTIGAIHHRRTSICAPITMFTKTAQFLHKADLVVNVVVPYLLMTFLVVFTWRGILRISALRKSALPVDQGRSVLCPKAEVTLAKSVTFYCISFLLLTLPTQGLRVLHDVRDTFHIHIRPGIEELLWQHITQVIFQTSFSANLFVLLIVHRTFRKALRQLLLSWFFRLKTAVHNLRKPRDEYLGIQAFQFTVEFSSTLVRLKETNLQ
jgi:hypothetical protein